MHQKCVCVCTCAYEGEMQAGKMITAFKSLMESHNSVMKEAKEKQWASFWNLCMSSL